jgi:hypothetical protein
MCKLYYEYLLAERILYKEKISMNFTEIELADEQLEGISGGYGQGHEQEHGHQDNHRHHRKHWVPGHWELEWHHRYLVREWEPGHWV